MAENQSIKKNWGGDLGARGSAGWPSVTNAGQDKACWLDFPDFAIRAARGKNLEKAENVDVSIFTPKQGV